MLLGLVGNWVMTFTGIR